MVCKDMYKPARMQNATNSATSRVLTGWPPQVRLRHLLLRLHGGGGGSCPHAARGAVRAADPDRRQRAPLHQHLPRVHLLPGRQSPAPAGRGQPGPPGGLSPPLPPQLWRHPSCSGAMRGVLLHVGATPDTSKQPRLFWAWVPALLALASGRLRCCNMVRADGALQHAVRAAAGAPGGGGRGGGGEPVGPACHAGHAAQARDAGQRGCGSPGQHVPEPAAGAAAAPREAAAVHGALPGRPRAALRWRCLGRHHQVSSTALTWVTILYI